MPRATKLLPNNNGMREPYRPRKGDFGPPGRDYVCDNCGRHWRVITGRWQCPHCYYYSPALGGGK